MKHPSSRTFTRRSKAGRVHGRAAPSPPSSYTSPASINRSILTPHPVCWLGCLLWLVQPAGGAEASLANPPPPVTWALRAEVEVDGQGIFLPQLVDVSPVVPLPNLRLGDAPPMGRPALLSPAHLLQAVHAQAPQLVPSRWAGAEQVNVRRRTRNLSEAEMIDLLRQTLQVEYIGQRGDLDLRLNRAWTPVLVPDDPLTVRVVDLPTAGVTAYFIVRFEILSGNEVIGGWQASLQAQVWKEVWVARSPLARKQSLLEADLVRERRDVLSFREPLFDLARTELGLEIAQGVSAGMPLLQRHVQVRPVVHRGQVVDAQLQEGPLMISMKVEVLENGAPGELVRVRNPKTRREFRGKVSNAQTILVTL